MILFVSLPVIALLIILFMPRSKSDGDDADKSNEGTPAAVEPSDSTANDPSPSKEPSPLDDPPETDANDSNSNPDVPSKVPTGDTEPKTSSDDGD